VPGALWASSAVYEVLLCQRNGFHWEQILYVLLPLPFLLVWVLNNPALFYGRTRQSWAEWIFVLCLFTYVFKLTASPVPQAVEETAELVLV